MAANGWVRTRVTGNRYSFSELPSFLFGDVLQFVDVVAVGAEDENAVFLGVDVATVVELDGGHGHIDGLVLELLEEPLELPHLFEEVVHVICAQGGLDHITINGQCIAVVCCGSQSITISFRESYTDYISIVC